MRGQPGRYAAGDTRAAPGRRMMRVLVAEDHVNQARASHSGLAAAAGALSLVCLQALASRRRERYPECMPSQLSPRSSGPPDPNRPRGLRAALEAAGCSPTASKGRPPPRGGHRTGRHPGRRSPRSAGFTPPMSRNRRRSPTSMPPSALPHAMSRALERDGDWYCDLGSDQLDWPGKDFSPHAASPTPRTPSSACSGQSGPKRHLPARSAGRRALWRGLVAHTGCASPGPLCGGWTRG